ncbi:MAG: DUF2889 domain-containing protein [Spongiibacteraceae bacterium]
MSNIFPRFSGRGRRQIDLKKWDANTVVGWLEDDFHHFGVTVKHDGHFVTDVHMSSPRTPWSTCGGASEPLKALIGKPLISRSSEIGKLIEMRLQCTHVYDLTGLVLAHAASGREHRRYHVICLDRALIPHEGQRTLADFGPGRIELYRDDELVMWWDIERDFISAPAAAAGQSLQQGFRQWTETMPLQEAEYATIMRRAMLVAGGRSMDHDDYLNGAAMEQPPLCHSFQPEQRDYAWRHYGNTQNYEDTPEQMLRFVNHRA